MSDTAAHEYAREGNIDALNEYISSNPNDINSKSRVRILICICNYMIHYQYQSNHYQISLLVYDGIGRIYTIT
jgi:hypothetical protein